MGLSAITFHAYPFHHGGGPAEQLISNLVNATKLDECMQPYKDMSFAVATASRAEYAPELWMGEGNAAGYGGRPGITDTFANSFWYLHAMGSAAGLGIKRFLRQAFIGGDYELVNRTTFQPNPDYFAALLWRRTVGSKVLASNVSHASLRVHAFCAQSSHPELRALGVQLGDVVVVTLNLDALASANVSLDLTGPRLTWYLRAATPGNITSREVALQANDGWRALRLEMSALPEMQPLREAEGTELHLEPHSYAFSVVLGAHAAACQPPVASVI